MENETIINLLDEGSIATLHKSLKSKYRQVFCIEVNLDADDTTQIANIFVKYPDRAGYDAIMSAYRLSVINAIEIFVKSNYIGGDPLEVISNNDYALRSLDQPMSEILLVRQSRLKKN